MFSRSCSDLKSLEHSQYSGFKIPRAIYEEDDDDEPLSPGSRTRRIIIVTNQLPVKILNIPGVKWAFELDEDAISLQLKVPLVLEHLEVVYVGCLKIFVPPSDRDQVSSILFDGFKCVPVYVSDEVYNRHYHGFCKNYLWPVLHYKVPSTINWPEMVRFGSCYDNVQWRGYVSTNLMFAHRVMDEVRRKGKKNLVWIHDYHLMLVPTLIRRHDYNLKVGFFHHSPFPSPEIFGAVPFRVELLRGLMNCNLVGFHIYDYAKHFISGCNLLMGIDFRSENDHFTLDYHGRDVNVEILPIGIHTGRFQTLMSEPETAVLIRGLKKRFEGKAVVVGVDDMDALKGLTLKFSALDYLLESRPALRGKLVLVQIINPARTRGTEVRELEEEIRNTARVVNGKFSTPGYDPIVVIEDPVSTIEKAAYYAIADCCLLNAIRDGMNLIPFEYTACRQGSPETDSPKCSTIVVSEYVGCSPSLTEAIRVNPWNVVQVAEAIHASVTMSETEKCRRHERHFDFINSNDIEIWSKNFYNELMRACDKPAPLQVWGVGFGLNYRMITVRAGSVELRVESVQEAYNASGNRLILLDYEECVHGVEVLNALCRDRRNSVFIVRGRGVEENEGFVIWHYKEREEDEEMAAHLESVLSRNEAVGVGRVKRVKLKVEVEMQGVNKAIVVESVMGAMRNMGKSPEFVLCIGEDGSDEDMFAATLHDEADPTLPSIAHIFNCTVGQKPSLARYYLDDPSEAHLFLWGISQLRIRNFRAYASTSTSTCASSSRSGGIFQDSF